ncbi:MAG TPA: helix-turn-helix domain-containing protein, partial [Cytophagaceae bacterium]|nr:helix-turn-helix domain-containing protein [Cytophagaceae bacterium]
MDAKDIILKGALEMFMRYGIKSITMDDISRSLGVSKKTIYQYFIDKEALIGSCVEDNVKMHRELLETISIEAKDALDEMI